ncbi:MAG: endonuclease domain-containing protein [Gammaproteobacteria bacterium]|jgi:very-short-patch-repair endonuclease
MKERARALRVRQTDAERLLWFRLRNRQLCGCKFRRQQVMGAYIVDFVCMEPKLVIELDGGQHSWQDEYDARRSRYLNGLGFKVLRFWNSDVLNSIDAVLESIRQQLISSPLPQGEGQGEGEIIRS